MATVWSRAAPPGHRLYKHVLSSAAASSPAADYCCCGASNCCPSHCWSNPGCERSCCHLPVGRSWTCHLAAADCCIPNICPLPAPIFDHLHSPVGSGDCGGWSYWSLRAADAPRSDRSFYCSPRSSDCCDSVMGSKSCFGPIRFHPRCRRHLEVK